MELVDRDEEIGRLRRATAVREGGLVVVWGRRRVGKTRLLLEWVRSAGGLYWVADESAPAIQRRYFSEALETRFPGFAQAEYSDWGRLFDRLGREAGREGFRGPLVIDELPYLAALVGEG